MRISHFDGISRHLHNDVDNKDTRGDPEQPLFRNVTVTEKEYDIREIIKSYSGSLQRP